MTAFRKLHQFNKHDETGAVVGAFVSLTDPVTNDTISAELEGDHRQTSEQVLVELVKEDFYKRHYADKVMLETVAKVDEALTGLTDYQKRQEEVNARIFTEIEALKRAQKGKANPVEHSVEIEV